MLMALSLAEKLSDKGLIALSLHPGVIMTNLGTHLDWSKDLAEICELPTEPIINEYMPPLKN
jgi:hypothetical protein